MNTDDLLLFREQVKAELSRLEAQASAKDVAGIQKAFADGSKRIQRIEYILYIVIAAVLLGPGVAAEFVKKMVGL